MDSQDIDSVIQNGLMQKRIDAFIANQIHQITKAYDRTLLQIMTQCDFIFKDPSDDMTNTRVLCAYMAKLNQYLLLDLWEHWGKNDYITKCIQTLSYIQSLLQSSVEKYRGYEWNEYKLIKFLNQHFSHSRTLLGIYGSELIGKIIDDNFHMGGYSLKIVKVQTEIQDHQKILEGIKSSKDKILFKPTEHYIFSYLKKDESKIEINLQNKIGGGQFGGIFEVVAPITKRYFCKAYWGYPFKGNFNSEKAFTLSISFVCSDDLLNNGKKEIQYSPLNFKELFVYKVLEYLEMGPKSYFLKIPILKDGFFIITEDLNSEYECFIEMSKIDGILETLVNSILLYLKRGSINADSYGQFHALTGLLEMDTINRIFNLHDSHDGNFGYLAKEHFDSSQDSIDLNMGENWLKQEHKFKIVDFIAPSTDSSYEIKNIFQTFLDGNSVTKYLKGHIMDFAICRQDLRRNEELIQKNNSEKIFFGKQVICSLEKRFKEYGGFRQLLLKAKENVLLFLNNMRCQEISDDALKAGIDDIDVYISGIIYNYNTLKESIETYEIK